MGKDWEGIEFLRNLCYDSGERKSQAAGSGETGWQTAGMTGTEKGVVVMIDRRAVKIGAREAMRTVRPSVLSASVIVTLVVFAFTLPTMIWGQEAVEVGGQVMYVPSTSPLMFFLDIFSTLLAWVLSAGLASFCLAAHRRQIPSYHMLMDGFGMAGKVIWLSLRMSIQIALWSMLFVIPGIIASLRYSFAVYCLMDDPTLTAGEALRRSCQKTQGWKMELFVLQISFIGWILLCVVPPIVVGTVIGVLVPSIGELGLALVLLVLLLFPTSWLLAYLGMCQIGYYRAAAPDSPGEDIFRMRRDPWSN